MKKNRINGFTLIELMIVVVIIGILAAIAFPSYRDSVRKTNRSDAKVALTRAAQMQERRFTEQGSYSNSIADVGGNTSPEGWYTMSLTDVSGTAGCTTTNSSGTTLYLCYTVTATATGGQADDATCATLSLDHTGAKTSTGGGDCW
ncbi:MAG: type IV pilin protein [Gammaproteobacteria bacterium]|nr:type IV pilin protein [Gammaproteobacteria bacterium]